MNIVLWVAATLLLAAGTAVYLVWKTDWAWWLYGFAAIPFFLLADRKLRPKEEDPRHGGFTDGPWGPP